MILMSLPYILILDDIPMTRGSTPTISYLLGEEASPSARENHPGARVLTDGQINMNQITHSYFVIIYVYMYICIHKCIYIYTYMWAYVGYLFSIAKLNSLRATCRLPV